LHDEEVGVVDIKLNGLEKILDSLLLRSVTIYQVFACTSKDNLTSDADLSILLKTNGRLLLVAIIEYYCNARLGNASLPTLINEVLQQLAELMSLLNERFAGYL
jgi:hypothetical protein